MSEQIVVELDPNGKTVEIEVKGGSGGRCLDLSRFLEESLGPVVSRRMKPERFVNRRILGTCLTVKQT